MKKHSFLIALVINPLNFGRMVAAGANGSNHAGINTGARSFTLNARFSF